jgi:hypothetical protein
MAAENLEDPKTQLAVALAQGVSVGAWARAHDVPRSTVYRWASEREVRKTVETCRRHAIDRMVGQMVKRGNWAVGGIAALAKGAESESVRLKAFRSILLDVLTVCRHTELESRMAQVEERLAQRDGKTA